MSKFRTKLKRHKKGAKWARGQSATSNPENKKHRNAARSRFFQPNLNADLNNVKFNKKYIYHIKNWEICKHNTIKLEDTEKMFISFKKT